MLISIISFFYVTLYTVLHPFHISVCEINHNEKEQVLEITHKFFLDDIEQALKETSDSIPSRIFDENNTILADSLLVRYLRSHFDITVNGKQKDYTYIGKEIEADALWCYLAIEKVKKVEHLVIKNSVLFGNFENQLNLVHVSCQQQTKSIRLENPNMVGKVNF